MTLSYIEGWHAITEANRIFGFDGVVILDLGVIRRAHEASENEAELKRCCACLNGWSTPPFEVLDPIRACDINGTRRGIVAMLLDPGDLEDSADQRAIQRYCTKHRAAIRERLARAQKARDKAPEQSAMPSCRARTQTVDNEVSPV
jgi:hypothetical protein